MRYYCKQCGAQNLRMKKRSNYGCALVLLDLVFLALAIPTFGLSLIGCLIVAACVKKKVICRCCGAENSLIPMDSPMAQREITQGAASLAASAPRPVAKRMMKIKCSKVCPHHVRNI